MWFDRDLLLLLLHCTCCAFVQGISFSDVKNNCGLTDTSREPDVVLEVDCGAHTLSWMTTDIQYYGLAYNCTNDSVSSAISSFSTRTSPLQVVLPASAIPSPGEECRYYGCIIIKNRRHLFYPVTCTGSADPPTSSPTPSPSSTTLTPSLPTLVPPTTTTTAATSLLSPTTMMSQESPPIIPTMSLLHSTAASQEMPASTSSISIEFLPTPTVRAPPNSTDGRVVLVVLTPLIIFLAIFLLLLLAFCHCYVAKMRDKKYLEEKKKRPEAVIQFEPEDFEYLFSSLPKKITCSLSEPSMCTLLEQLQPERTSDHKDAPWTPLEQDCVGVNEVEDRNEYVVRTSDKKNNYRDPVLDFNSNGYAVLEGGLSRGKSSGELELDCTPEEPNSNSSYVFIADGSQDVSYGGLEHLAWKPVSEPESFGCGQEVDSNQEEVRMDSDYIIG